MHLNYREDWEFLVKNKALPAERIRAVETGGCPHAAIREVCKSCLKVAKSDKRSFIPGAALCSICLFF